MSQRKGRSVVLNPELVRSIAKSKGINSQTELNIAVLALRAREGSNKAGGTTKAGDRAWNGEPISPKCANEVAQVLGVNSYHDLQERNGMSLWSQLRMDESRSADIFELKPLLRRGLYLIEDDLSEEEWKIAVDTPWQLILTHPDLLGYHILALLRNKEKHEVIVPSAHDFPTYFQQETVYIPSKTKCLRFDKKEGLGWREIIVIACRENIFPVQKKADDSCLDSTTRDKIAAQLMSKTLRQHYVIHSVAFELTQD